MGQLCHRFRHQIGRYGDQPLGPQRQHGKGLVVVAGPDVQLIAAEGHGLCQQGKIAGGLFGAVDPWVLAQDAIGLHRDRQSGAGGDIVEQDRQIQLIGQKFIVPDQPGLGGLVVIGRDQQQRICARLLGVLAEVERRRRVVAARTGDHLAPAGHMRHAVGDQMNVFLLRQRGALAGGAADAQGIHPGLQLAVHLPVKGGVVDGAGRQKWRDQRRTGSGKNRLFHKNSFHNARHKKTAQRAVLILSYRTPSGLFGCGDRQRGRM